MTGIDNCGPLYVKDIYGSANNRDNKVWVTLYTCVSSRVVLLDLVPSTSAASFMQSIGRMIARRSCTNNIISDNGSNFISCETQNYVANLGLKWHVNFTLDPWYGGFFERLVRSCKNLLKKGLRNSRLTFEELKTILLEVEMIVNNRSLTYTLLNLK